MMKIQRSLLPLIAILFTSLFLIAPYTHLAKVDVLFSPSGADHAMQKRIGQELSQATAHIRIAMYSFTSISLAKHLARLKKTKDIDIQIIIDKNQYEAIHKTFSAPFDIMKKAGIAIHTYIPKSFRAKARYPAKFHHKYCVIDAKTLLTGSYNWTIMGDESNHENIIILTDPKVAKQYIKEFDRIWKE